MPTKCGERNDRKATARKKRRRGLSLKGHIQKVTLDLIKFSSPNVEGLARIRGFLPTGLDHLFRWLIFCDLSVRETRHSCSQNLWRSQWSCSSSVLPLHSLPPNSWLSMFDYPLVFSKAMFDLARAGIPHWQKVLSDSGVHVCTYVPIYLLIQASKSGWYVCGVQSFMPSPRCSDKKQLSWFAVVD